MRINKKAIIAAIEADSYLSASALINGKVPGCRHVGRCAIGALLRHGGLAPATLKAIDRNADCGYAEHPKSGPILRKKYGLDEALVAKIVTCNDNFSCMMYDKPLDGWKARAKHVIEFIKGL